MFQTVLMTSSLSVKSYPDIELIICYMKQRYKSAVLLEGKAVGN